MEESVRLQIIYETAASMVTRTPEAWAEYLRFASQLHKYPFDNALLVYAQDPDASVLATEAIWKRLGRTPIDKAKRIAVCEYGRAGETLKYLLDVSQTTGPAEPEIWKVKEEVQLLLSIRLLERYNTTSPYLADAIAILVHEAMEQGFEPLMQDFELDTGSHFFSELPHDGLFNQIREIATASARIFVSARCGLKTRDADIQALATIAHFDTVPLAARLGSIVTNLSKTVLLTIENTIKTLENERSAEHAELIEPDILRERWPVVPEHQPGERRRTVGQIRTPVDGESAKAPRAEVYGPADARQAERDSGQGGARGAGASGNPLSAAIGEGPGPGDGGHAGESPAPEQPAADSRGNRAEGNRDDAPVEVKTESDPEKEPQGSFSLPVYLTSAKKIPYREGDIVRALTTEAILVRITEDTAYYRFPEEGEDIGPHSMERTRFEDNLENGTYRTITSSDSELYIGPAAENPPRVDRMYVSDEEIRQGYEFVLMNTQGMYPLELYAAIRKRMAQDGDFTEKGRDIAEIYKRFGGDAEFFGDKLYRTVLRGDDGMSVYIGKNGYTYLPWFTVANLIDVYIEEGIYPGTEIEDSLEDRIGSYNIPDEIDEMGMPEHEYVKAAQPLTDAELIDNVVTFLCLSYNLADESWQYRAATETYRENTGNHALYTLFRQIEGQSLATLDDNRTLCRAYPEYVSFQVSETEFNLSYDQLREHIKHQVELGEFAADMADTVDIRGLVVPAEGKPYAASYKKGDGSLILLIDPKGSSKLATHELGENLHAVYRAGAPDGPVRDISGVHIPLPFAVVRTDHDIFVSLTDSDIERCAKQLAPEDDYTQTDAEMYPYLDAFLRHPSHAGNGWTDEMADLLARGNSVPSLLFEMFQEIEESPLDVMDGYVECFALQNGVTFRINGRYDIDFTYEEAAEYIRSLMEIGDFTAFEKSADSSQTLHPSPAQAGPEGNTALLPLVNDFLRRADELYKGWTEEMGELLIRNSYNLSTLLGMFSKVEEILLKVDGGDILCTADENGVSFRTLDFGSFKTKDELRFGYEEIAGHIRSLMASGEFPVPPGVEAEPAAAVTRAPIIPTGQAQAKRQESEQSLEGTLYPFRRAKGQPDIANLQEPELDYNPADFVEIMDIPRFDEIDTFIPQPKVIDFHSAIGQKARKPNTALQLSIFDDNAGPEAPDASFDVDADDEDTPAISARELAEQAAESRLRHERINYRYSESDNLYPPGQKVKYRNNIAAIKLLKQIEAENRLATRDEQVVLARYVGWGGLSGAFDTGAADWQSEYAELRLLLDETEYKNARDSILTAYYTPPELAGHIYGALARFGFTDGKNRSILDPAYGTGNFSAVLPENLSGAKVTGVEIDSITARIARQLYQRNSVMLSGFETSGVKDERYDVVIGNVPFNEIKIFDSKYKNNFYVHDYFFIKSLDALKPGGIAALITSKGTMDKQDLSARMEMARRADLIGAIRLPNNTFKALAGTEVTTDILFFKKLPQMRDVTPSNAPDWCFSEMSRTHYFRFNWYFQKHPDMMLGDMREVSGRFGPEPECIAPEGQDLYPLLEQAISKLKAEFSAEPDKPQVPKVRVIAGEERETLKAPEGLRTYTYHIKDGNLYYCSDGQLIPQDFTGKRLERITGLCGIRDALREVIDIQSADFDTAELMAAQATLNKRYDAFIKRNGSINSLANAMAFSDDDTFPLLRSIEDYDKETDTWNKAPIFTRATIRPRRIPDHAESALQALEVSLNLKQRVDIPLMARLYGKSPVEVIAELGDKIYLNPQKYYGNPHEGWELDEEYLSGYVCDKLAYALLKADEYPEIFTRNVEALREVQPVPLLPGDIEYNIGSPWIPLWYYERFMYETFDTYARHQNRGTDGIYVDYMEYTNQWYVSGKNNEGENLKVNQTFGSGRASAYDIFEQTLNLQTMTIRDPVKYRDENGKEKVKYVVNAKETMIARGKQQEIRDAFKSWLFADKDRAEALLKLYNDKFNNIVPRTYDGSHLIFPGMSDEEELRPHQLNVAARIIYNGTALMAHEVGAGKTAAMIAAGMYMKHYGLIHKPVYVVPNHLVDQWSNEFMRFFPAANILVTSEKDFEKKNRQRFVSKIAMGEYDGIIISHSQYERIMVSLARQEKMLTDQINQLTFAIEKMKEENGQRWTIKQVVIFQKNLEARLERLMANAKKDDLIDFEDLGLDYMFVDEAHVYKNNFTYTKIRNVAGISNASSQRAADMKLKCEYLLETYGGRGVTFATGTPVSNTIAELFIMQMYLQPHELKKRGIDFFDNWAATYAKIVTSLEITPEGTGYRMRSRFAQFHNLPELMAIFRLVADIQTEEMLNLPTPEIEGGKAAVIQTECSPFQKEIIQSYVARSEAIRNGKVKPEEDNMLKLTHEARLLSIDPRLLYPDAPNDPKSKLNVCIRNIYDIWKETAKNRSTQILFCDSGTPKPGQFNVYDEVKSVLMHMVEVLFEKDEDEIAIAEAAKESLVEKGVPPEEIAFIHDCKTFAQREALFEKVRNGEVRILLGSTSKLGMGTNVQDRLLALHHLDCPWRPTDITQRNGRGKRQGNKNPFIRIFQYVTRGTFDSYLWQIQEQKLRYISQVMTGKAITRSCEDVDITVLNAAEIKAIATDNPLLLEKMTAENEVTRLTILRKAWQNERLILKRNIESSYPWKIQSLEGRIETVKEDMQTVSAHPTKGDAFRIELKGRTYDERSKAGQALLAEIRVLIHDYELFRQSAEMVVGSFRGTKLTIHCANGRTWIEAKGKGYYVADLGDNEIGNITRVENLLNGLRGVLTDYETQRAEVLAQLETAKKEANAPFAYENELNEQSQRLMEINTKLEFKELADQDAVLEDESGTVTGKVPTYTLIPELVR